MTDNNNKKQNLISKYDNMYRWGLFKFVNKEIETMIDLIYKMDDPKQKEILYTYYENWITSNDSKYLRFIWDALARADPDNILAWDMMIQANIKTGWTSAAILTLKHFLKLNPKDKFKWSMLAVVYASIRRYEEAIDCLTTQFEVYPENPSPLRALSDCFEKLGKQEQALDYLKRYIELRPEDVSANQQLELLRSKL